MHAVYIVLSALPALAAAHGYLCTPPPRGIQKEAYQIDDLKSPNRRGVCRGEPEGPIASYAVGAAVTLDFKITAPHRGPCTVFLLNADLGAPQEIASKMDCAAPGMVAPWTVQLPAGVAGRKVLRWVWEGQHVSPSEPYEQCVDLQIGGGEGAPTARRSGRGGQRGEVAAYDDDDEVEYNHRAPSYAPVAAAAAAESVYDDQSAYGDDSGDTEPTYGAPAPLYDNGNASEYDAAAPAYDQEPVYEVAREQTGCEQGRYECSGGVGNGGFAICNDGQWVQQSCGVGQVCVPTGSSITCGLAGTGAAY